MVNLQRQRKIGLEGNRDANDEICADDTGSVFRGRMGGLVRRSNRTCTSADRKSGSPTAAAGLQSVDSKHCVSTARNPRVSIERDARVSIERDPGASIARDARAAVERNHSLSTTGSSFNASDVQGRESTRGPI